VIDGLINYNTITCSVMVSLLMLIFDNNCLRILKQTKKLTEPTTNVDFQHFKNFNFNFNLNFSWIIRPQ